MTKLHNVLLGATGLALILAATPMTAAAQSQPAAASTVEEVVVTARKRAESLLDVPMSVSAFSGEQLRAAGVKSANDLYGRAPGLYFSNAGAAAPTSDFVYLSFRGVGANAGQEPAAGVFIDGMYQPQLGFDIGFLDLAQLEVLRGPQGTLFGRNTEAGALNLVTRKPDQDLHVRLEGEAARFDAWRLFGAVSGPLSDKVAAGISAEHADGDGFTYNPATGKPQSPTRRSSVRGALRFTPTDQLDIVLSADATRRKGNEIAFGAPLECHCYAVYADNDQTDTKDTSGVQLNIDWKFGPGLTLTSITGLRKAKSDIGFDFDGTPTGQQPTTANGVTGSTVAPGPVTFGGMFQRLRLNQTFKSQELRLAGDDGRFTWLIGLYGFKQDQHQVRDFDVGAGVAHDPAVAYLIPLYIREDFTNDRKGWAAFGQASWRPADRVELTGGLRWSDESVDIGGQRVRNIVQLENAHPTFFALAGDKDFSNLSSMVSIRYDLTPSVKPYFTISQGWKAGGYNRFPSTAAAALPYDSESSVNYELGLKGSFLDRRLTANLAAFHIDISDQQLLTVTPDASGVPVTTITNAGKSKSQGVEAELSLAASQGLRLSLAGGYTRARYVHFLQCAAANVCISRDGDPFEYTPELTGTAAIDYQRPLGGAWTLEAHADYRYVGGSLAPNGSFLAALGEEIKVPAYRRANLRVSAVHDRLKLTGYVENLFDTYDYTVVQGASFFPTGPGQTFVQPLAPRTVGVVISYQF
ncbi:TonB-dependent receptor [Caulobacter soli]|uniref:TonB-dependent receptor n=1 Tax=Caulobacter soli TaxID=2708539 RepID=UPI0013ED14C2|nr:TonB-dependent receptor [Caulobacter soli]